MVDPLGETKKVLEVLAIMDGVEQEDIDKALEDIQWIFGKSIGDDEPINENFEWTGNQTKKKARNKLREQLRKKWSLDV